MLLEIAGVVWVSGWVSGWVYRVGVLMYGKRPTSPEVVRWVQRR